VHSHLLESGLASRLLSVPVPEAERRWLTRVHDSAYLDWLQSASTPPTRHIDQDTYIGPGSYRAAVHAVGAAISCAAAILGGQARSGIALVRPPGHHARRNQAMGFCLLNSVACAAAYALEEGGLQRILILDFDVHHGNGTQEAFWTDPRVLYISLHQFPLFPGSGLASERGDGAGAGYTVNLPLPPHSGDRSLAFLMDTIIEPLADAFRPELVLLSAGYDAHWRDPLANLAVTVSGFDDLAARALALAERHCGGRLLAVLEGGYDPQVLSFCIGNLAEILLGTPGNCTDPFGPPPMEPIEDSAHLERLRRALSV